MLITRGSTQIPTRCSSGSLLCSNVANTVQVSKHCSKVVSFASCIRKLSAHASLSVNRFSKLVSFSSPISLLCEIVIHCNKYSNTCQCSKINFYKIISFLIELCPFLHIPLFAGNLRYNRNPQA